MELREFTKADWKVYPGGKSIVLPNGIKVSPMTNRIEFVLLESRDWDMEYGLDVVVDKDNICLYSYHTIIDDDDVEHYYEEGWGMEIPFLAGRAIVEEMPNEIPGDQLELWGFTYLGEQARRSPGKFSDMEDIMDKPISASKEAETELGDKGLRVDGYGIIHGEDRYFEACKKERELKGEEKCWSDIPLDMGKLIILLAQLSATK